MTELVYQPPLSVEGFLRSGKFINLIIGPVGSTKTTAGIIKISEEARAIVACRDGVRRSKCIWVRNTREQLRDTTLPDFLKWYPDGAAGDFAKTEFKFMLRFDDVECEVLFRGLEDANDVRRLLSLNATFAVFDEFREINPEIFNQMQTRIGRYPDKSMNGVGACKEVVVDGKTTIVKSDKIWGMSNPPDSDTFWEELLSDPPVNTAVFFQPSGMSPEADWLHYLKDGYYDDICQNKSQDWIDVYVHAKFGRSLAGMPVFRCFNADVHVSKEPIKPQQNTLIIGVDAGLNPTAVITQQTYDGRIIVLDAITGNVDGMGALRFSREKLKPLLANKYQGKPILLIVDPAAFQRAQTDERSVADILKIEGFTVRPAKTNNISPRIAAVESFMTRTVGKLSGLLIDKYASDNHQLIIALRSKYRYKTNTKGERDDKPEKSHPWSDFADALQYACLHHDGGRVTGGVVASARRVVKPAPMRWAA